MSETGITPTRRDEDEKICGNDGCVTFDADAGIGKRRHGVHFGTVPLLKRPQPSFAGGWFLLCGRKRMMAQMRRNNRVEERTFDSSAERAFCARETPTLKNFCKNGQMGVNFRVFLRLDR